MAWFYYSGQTVTPVDLGNGNSVGVRPHTHVEVPDGAASNGSIQRLMGMGVLRRSGMPEHARKAEAKMKAEARAKAPDLAVAVAPDAVEVPSSVTLGSQTLQSGDADLAVKQEVEVSAANEVQEKPKRKKRRRRTGEESGGPNDQ